MFHTLVLSLDHVQETCEEGMKVASLVQKCNSRTDLGSTGSSYSTSTREKNVHKLTGGQGKKETRV